mmetsp:Transcript_404/g.3071  ORF Transcript_404/g.3071 Transcript_404/m.3071 type:complete len:230 (+) Transcript_404:444-1133(+)
MDGASRCTCIKSGGMPKVIRGRNTDRSNHGRELPPWDPRDGLVSRLGCLLGACIHLASKSMQNLVQLALVQVGRTCWFCGRTGVFCTQVLSHSTSRCPPCLHGRPVCHACFADPTFIPKLLLHIVLQGLVCLQELLELFICLRLAIRGTDLIRMDFPRFLAKGFLDCWQRSTRLQSQYVVRIHEIFLVEHQDAFHLLIQPPIQTASMRLRGPTSDDDFVRRPQLLLDSF